MKVGYIKKENLILFLIVSLIILFQERFLYTIDQSLVYILSVGGLICFFVYLIRGKILKYDFSIFIIFYLIIEFYGIFIAKIFYGQKLMVGIYGVHYMFLYGYYFLFVDLIKNKGNVDINVNTIKNTIYFWCFIICVLIVIQWFWYPLEFLKLNFAMRNGLRINGSHIIQYGFALACCDLLRKFTVKKFLFCIFIGLEIILIMQSRNVILVFGIIIIVLMFFKLFKDNKLLFFTLGVMSLLTLLILVNNNGLNVWNEIFEEATTKEGTTGIRIYELEFYFNSLKNNNFLGIGVLGDSFSLKSQIYGNDKYFYMEDIGISAFIFKTGIIGLIWTICWIFKLFRQGTVVNAKYKYLAYFVAIKTVMSLFFSVSFIFDFRDGLIYFIIVLSILDIAHHNDETVERC